MVDSFIHYPHILGKPQGEGKGDEQSEDNYQEIWVGTSSDSIEQNSSGTFYNPLILFHNNFNIFLLSLDIQKRVDKEEPLPPVFENEYNRLHKVCPEPLIISESTLLR